MKALQGYRKNDLLVANQKVEKSKALSLSHIRPQSTSTPPSVVPHGLTVASDSLSGSSRTHPATNILEEIAKDTENKDRGGDSHSTDLIFRRLKNEEWLALEDDFRTPGISQIVTELPQFNQFLAR